MFLAIADVLSNILLIVSILLIAIVLLQSGKAESASNVMMGGNVDLFQNRKEEEPNCLLVDLQ